MSAGRRPEKARLNSLTVCRPCRDGALGTVAAWCCSLDAAEGQDGRAAGRAAVG